MKISNETRYLEVIHMAYADLQNLIAVDHDASSYFNSLPDYVREHINTRSQNIKSFDDLISFAENYMQGDK